MSHKQRIRANRQGQQSRTGQDATQAAPEHLGGSWYAMPDGSKVQGKTKALEAFKAFA